MAAHRRFGVSVSAAHVCAVLALPPPLADAPGGELHGQRYLALDLFPVSAAWQSLAYKCVRITIHAAHYYASENGNSCVCIVIVSCHPIR